MRQGLLALAGALFLLGGGGACSQAVTDNGQLAEPRVATTLVVDNQNWLDMDIYVTRSPVGQWDRLGTATGSATTSMVIPAGVLVGVATPLRFVAEPIGGTRRSVSSEVLVNPGDNVALQIPSFP